MFRIAFLGFILIFVACKRNTKNTNLMDSKIIAQWCDPSLEFENMKVPLTPDEKGQWPFILGGLEKMYKDMCIEYFDDRTGSRDSYKLTFRLPGDIATNTEFGEYELLASGTRLLMYTPKGKKINIGVSKLDDNMQQWYLQIADLLKLAGDTYELPEDMPNIVIHLTFHKKYNEVISNN